MSDYAVIGFCTNQDPSRVSIFSASLRAIYSPEECDIVLITNEVTEELKTLARKYKIEFRYTRNVVSSEKNVMASALRRILIASTAALARSSSRHNSLNRISRVATDAMIECMHHPFFARFVAYRDVLLSDYGRVGALLTDVKDVVFQRPFFSRINDANTPVKMFKQGVVYGDGPNWDTKWYVSAFGNKALRNVVGQEPVCAGTLLGGQTNLLKVCDQFLDFVRRHPFKGVDQPVLNHLLYTRQFSAAIEICELGEGEIMTLSSGATGFAATPEGDIVGKNNQPFPVVHMWDRFDAIQRAVLRRWGPIEDANPRSPKYVNN